MRRIHNFQEWAMMLSAFLLAPWIGTFAWIQVHEEVVGDDAEWSYDAGTKPSDQDLSGAGLTELADAAVAENSGQAGELIGNVAVKDRSIIIDQGEQKLYRRLEDFLPGVVASQMPDAVDKEEYSPEVWKCQAVIARTYICNLMQGRMEIHEEELDLDYLGDIKLLSRQRRSLAVHKLELAEEAVRTTEGIVMKYEGDYILPMFHEMSAGRTRSGGAEFPYLQSADCSQDTRREDYLQTFTFSKGDFAEKISRITDAAPVAAGQLPGEIQTVKKDEAGYMEEVKIGAGSYTGDEIRYSLGLPSAHFSLEAAGESVKVIVRGRGHGYGLSQAGADSLAEEGWGYEDILPLFYKGIELVHE